MQIYLHFFMFPNSVYTGVALDLLWFFLSILPGILRRGERTHRWGIFSRKLHEIEKEIGPIRRLDVPSTPLRSANEYLFSFYLLSVDFCYVFFLNDCQIFRQSSFECHSLSLIWIFETRGVNCPCLTHSNSSSNIWLKYNTWSQ